MSYLSPHCNCFPLEDFFWWVPHLLSTMTDSATCRYEHSRFQSLSPDQVQYLFLSSDTDAHSVNGSKKTIHGM